MPTFYDKLLQVPVLNLSIKLIDRIAHSERRVLDRRRHLVFMSGWAVIFIAMSLLQGVGDAHPGQWLPFWRQACEQGRPYACPYLADLQTDFCNQGSGWACNEAGLLHITLVRSGEDRRRTKLSGAIEPFSRGCDLKFEAACRNLKTLTVTAGELTSAPPMFEDYPIILRGSKGKIRERDPAVLYAMACSQGWPDACSARTSRLN
jgi:hypothetical protein